MFSPLGERAFQTAELSCPWCCAVQSSQDGARLALAAVARSERWGLKALKGYRSVGQTKCMDRQS